MSNTMTALAECTFSGGKIRMLGTQWEPWFVGKDICDALGYKNHNDAIAKHVDEDDKGVAKCDTPGGAQNMVIINESGMYALIFGSELPEAKKFKRWVTHEVLPQIRKHGSYIPNRREGRGRQPLYLQGKADKPTLVHRAVGLGMRRVDAAKLSRGELESFCEERDDPAWIDANLQRFPHSFKAVNRIVGGHLGLVVLYVPRLDNYVLNTQGVRGVEEDWCFSQEFVDKLWYFAKKAGVPMLQEA